ncbi:unnamed protein product [Cylicocyclus nassatus]|uniref:Uncharacterized protein n=1 Tax=Cylicocyclus nassatus TaxID=53992 RepID=A0AA36HA68_CYLNA|nr:unnamed protein product [Cylicocyclus nassatus]
MPTTVYIQMYIEGMSSFRAQSMDFQVDIYFQEKWVDRRLAHNNTKRILVKDPHLFKLIWHPDIYFANARTAAFHDVTQPNFLLWVYPNDAYDSDEIVVKWNGPNPVDVNPEIRMPDMRLRYILPSLRNDTYATGIWSCALAEFHVDREIMHHIIQSYLPTSLIVVISWFSFWLDVEAVPGRVSLSITTLLTLATQSSAARMALPQASYVKAIDVWMGACMTFVFSAMIEFTVVNYCTRRKSRKRPKPTPSLSEQVQNLIAQYKEKKAGSNTSVYELMRSIQHTTVGYVTQQLQYQNGTCYEVTLCDESAQENFAKKQIREMNQPPTLQRQNFLTGRKRKAMEERMNRVEENRKYAQSIDRRSRFYFPIAFVIFNICYWVYYLKFAKDTIG